MGERKRKHRITDYPAQKCAGPEPKGDGGDLEGSETTVDVDKNIRDYVQEIRNHVSAK